MNDVKKPIFPFDAIPDSGFIADYMLSREKLTESPLEFHFGAAASLIAAALGGMTYWPTPRKYPNLWVLLLAPSTVYRKTTAISLASQLLAEGHEELILPNMLSSREGLFERLAKDPRGLLETAELAPLLEGSSAKGLIGFLTDVYDCPAHKERRTARGRTFVVKNPTVSWLAASTPAWLVKLARESDILGGFWPRWSFVLAPDEVPPAKPNPSGIDDEEEQALSEQLTALVPEESAAAVVTDSATAVRKLSYLENRARVLDFGDGSAQAFLSRSDDMTVKLALIFAASEQSRAKTGEIVIEGEHVEAAARVSRYFADAALWTLKDLTWTKAEREKARVLGIVQRGCEREHGPMPYGHVLKNYSGLAPTLQPILATLLADGTLEEVTTAGKRAFVPAGSKFGKPKPVKLKKIK